MFGNTFGEHLKVTTFGESHGPAIGGVIEGFPAGIAIDEAFIQSELDRRKPNQSVSSTLRKESDRVEILSGVFEGKSLGTPIAFLIRNENQRSGDYEALKDLYRPGHAEYTYDQKYGTYDYRGGGRASARETASRVVAGAFAKTVLKEKGIEIKAYIKQIGQASTSNDIDQLLHKTKNEGDSLGGIIECEISGLPAGIGDPVFAKLQAKLAEAMLSIPAAKGFEYGEGFNAVNMKGSEHNDTFALIDNKIKPRTNRAGGILGGISTGLPVIFRIVFKPIASISKTQITTDKNGIDRELNIQGRHDVSCVPRAVPIVEAMAALVLGDFGGLGE